MKIKSLSILAGTLLVLLVLSFFMGPKDNVVPLDDLAFYSEEQTSEDEDAHEQEPETNVERPVPTFSDKDEETTKDVEEENKECPEEKQENEPAVEVLQPNDDAKVTDSDVNQPKQNVQDEKKETVPTKQEPSTKTPETVKEAPGKQEQKEKIIAEDNKKGDKDKYLTDPVPEGKPQPVEWQDVDVDDEIIYTATLSVTAKTILNNMHLFNKDKIEVLPDDGVIYSKRTVSFHKGESVFDVLLREMRKHSIHMEFVMTPIYNSNYIEGINNIYEFDCGELSGWMYRVNGWFPNYGASRYQLENNDEIEWIYTCDLGRDIGGYQATGGG